MFRETVLRQVKADAIDVVKVVILLESVPMSLKCQELMTASVMGVEVLVTFQRSAQLLNVRQAETATIADLLII